MKQICSFILLSGFLFINESDAQTRYLVQLKNKAGTPFTFSTPSAYLSQRAIDRRTRYGIAIDSTDLPATPSYITQIRNVANVTVLNVSKWLNSVSIQTSDPNAITTISGFSFVQSVSGLAARTINTEVPAGNKKFEEITEELPTTQRTTQAQADFFNYGANSFNEIKLHNGQFLHNIGLRGQGMRIAMLDAGFTNYATLRSFDSMNINNQLLDTWDFVSRHADVNDHSHGMQCLSTIVANIPGQFIGKAPKALFYLYRTEDAPTEYPIEEHNWSCGAERADSIGADIISTSLGYSDFDPPLTGSSHTYADMNGNTTMAAIAADLAAKKGLMVFASVGNDGGSAWHYLITPSDGDSVIAVGAVDTLGNVAGFSSYGPSSDGRVKPDVASIGSRALVQATNNTVGTSNGTSFACPNMAGLGTCLWQGFPEFNNIKILKALQQAGSISANPNDRIGYGIPDMKAAFANLLIDFATSTSTIDTCTATIMWTSKDISAMKYEIERKLPGQLVYTKIGELQPQAGLLLANHSYQFSNTIINSPAGMVSYRIRQIIDTGSSSFTAVYIDTTMIAISSSCFADHLISIASSSGFLNNCTVTVNWSSKDNGAMKYEVERKAPGESAYSKIGDVAAQSGNVLTMHNYSFINDVNNLTAGLISYRIREIYDTAAVSFAAVYIDTVNVTLAFSCIPAPPGPDKVSVIPNPTSSTAFLEVETSYAVSDMPVNIYDSKGRLVNKMKLSKGIGKATFNLQIERLAGGTYFIIVYNSGKIIGTTEMVKL